MIARRATVTLEAPDAEAAAGRIRALLAEGEYVEAATLVAQRRQGSSTLTLRIRPERLDGFLADLRAVGEVLKETVAGDDVTAQAVDLDARLRNERRVEEELLELLAAREDADLEDILAVRRELAGVRERIERAEAQREAISRRVALATVTIELRTPAFEPRAEPLGFGRRLEDAWRDGLRSIQGSVLWLVEVAVGGLVAWIITGVLGLIGWRLWRRGSR